MAKQQHVTAVVEAVAAARETFERAAFGAVVTERRRMRPTDVKDLSLTLESKDVRLHVFTSSVGLWVGHVHVTTKEKFT